jgi:hypothetical protein
MPKGPMKLTELSIRIDARLHLAGATDRVVRQVYAADTMSDLMEHASADTLLVTSLRNNQLIRVAELMDVPGICLTNGMEPGPELLSQAAAVGTAILVSPVALQETRSRVDACLAGHEAAQA